MYIKWNEFLTVINLLVSIWKELDESSTNITCIELFVIEILLKLVFVIGNYQIINYPFNNNIVYNRKIEEIHKS